MSRIGSGRCQPYRAKTKGKVERPFRYIRQDFFLGRTFHNLEDLNVQFDHRRATIAKPRRIDGRKVWDRRQLEEAFAALPIEGGDRETPNPWDSVSG